MYFQRDVLIIYLLLLFTCCLHVFVYLLFIFFVCSYLIMSLYTEITSCFFRVVAVVCQVQYFIAYLHVCCCDCCGNVYILFLNLFTRYWVSAQCMSSSSISSLPRSNKSLISAKPSHPLLVCECMTAFLA